MDSWKGQAPWNGNASSEATLSYAIFSNAAERYALANNQEATEDMRGRAWRVGTRITIASLACPPEHFYRKPMLAFWEKLGTAMRQVRSFLGTAHENLLGDILEETLRAGVSSCVAFGEMAAPIY